MTGHWTKKHERRERRGTVREEYRGGNSEGVQRRGTVREEYRGGEQ